MKKIARLGLSFSALLTALGAHPAASVPVPVFASPNVELIATIPVDGGAISGQIRQIGDKKFFFASTVKGISAYDVTNPELPVPFGELPLPNFENEDVDGAGDVLLVNDDPAFTTSQLGGVYILDVSMLPAITFKYVNPATGNRYKGTYGTRAYNGGHTINCVTADCTWAYDVGAGGGSNRITVLDLRDPAAPQIATQFASPVGGTHEVELDANGTAWMVGEDGVVAYDVSDPMNPRTLGFYDAPGLNYIHNSQKRGNTLLVTEEDWLQPACLSQGRFGTVDATNVASMRQLDIWQPPFELAPHSQAGPLCSAHWFDERNGIVAISWYQQGTYFLDVSTPSDIKLAGFFTTPNTASWASYWLSDEIVYVLDAGRGIDILRYRAPIAPVEASLAAAAAALGRVPAREVPAVRTGPTWGFACAVPARPGRV